MGVLKVRCLGDEFVEFDGLADIRLEPPQLVLFRVLSPSNTAFTQRLPNRWTAGAVAAGTALFAFTPPARAASNAWCTPVMV